MDNLKPKCTNSKIKKKREPRSNKRLENQKECEKKALSIVIELIDGGLDEDILLKKLQSINACHYEDVIEERFILKQCGYVVCNQNLSCIPLQTYKISLAQCKVYDITERKKFCSNKCYKSSIYLHSQLLTSPLWMRDSEVVPEFRLMETESKKSYKHVSNSDEILKINISNLKI